MTSECQVMWQSRRLWLGLGAELAKSHGSHAFSRFPIWERCNACTTSVTVSHEYTYCTWTRPAHMGGGFILVINHQGPGYPRKAGGGWTHLGRSVWGPVSPGSWNPVCRPDLNHCLVQDGDGGTQVNLSRRTSTERCSKPGLGIRESSRWLACSGVYANANGSRWCKSD